MRRGARWVARIAAVAAACALTLPLTAAAAHTEAPGAAAVSVVPLRPLGPNDDPTTPPGPDDGGVWTNQLCEMFTKEDVPNYQQWRKFCLDHPGLRSADNTEITFHNTVYRMPTRWLSAASGYFSKLDGVNIGATLNVASRNFADAPYMSAGNGMWSASAGLVQAATSFDAISGIGGQMDMVGGALVNGLLSGAVGSAGTSLMVILLALIVVAAIIRSIGRGAGVMIRRLCGLGVMIGLLLGMSAQYSKTTGMNPGETYSPAPLTPGWFVKVTNESLAKYTSSVADGIAGAINGIGTIATPDGTKASDLFNCAGYDGDLWSELQEMGKIVPSLDGGQVTSVSKAMDSMWMITGIETWKRTQLGYNNPYADVAYCHVLDFRSNGVTAYGALDATRDQALARGANIGDFKNPGGSLPFNPTGDKNQAGTMVAWAACQATGMSADKVPVIQWKWRDGWLGFDARTGNGPGGSTRLSETGDNSAQTLCTQWWTDRADPKDPQSQAVPKQFELEGNPDDIAGDAKGAADPEAVADYARAVTGVGAAGNQAATISYAVGALMALIAFGFVALISFLAKFALAGFIIALWFVFFAAMFVERPWKERIGKTLNQMLGLSVFASLITAVLALVALVARVLITVGTSMFGAGSLFSMIWSGLSPIVALVFVHVLFKKVFKLPSPVSIGGAMAWGKAGASGAIGAGLSAGVGSAAGSFLGTRLGSMARGAGRRVGSNLLNRASGGRLGTRTGVRRSEMGAPVAKTASQVQGEKSEQMELESEQLTSRRKQLAEARAWAAEQSGRRSQRQKVTDEVQERRAERARLRDSRRDTRLELKAAAASGDIARMDQLRREQQCREQILAGGAELRRQTLTGATKTLSAMRDLPALTAARARAGASERFTGLWNSAPATAMRVQAGMGAGHVRSIAKAAVDNRAVHAAAEFSRDAGITAGAQAIGRYGRQVANRRGENTRLLERYQAAQLAQAQAQEDAASKARADASRAEHAQVEAAAQAERMAQAQANAQALIQAGVFAGAGANPPMGGGRGVK